jgi:ATP adenylyltransferase
MSDGKKVVDERYARERDDYLQALREIQARGDCPFCEDDLGGWHKKPILHKIGSWLITEASWPYENAKHHFMIVVTRDHMTTFAEMNLNDWESVSDLVEWATREYNIKGGALTARFGDTAFTGATVCHLHFHLIVPDIEQGHVVFPIG